MSALESSPDPKRIIGVVTGTTTRWKTVSVRQIYSMKIIQALRRTRTRVRTIPKFAFRETADRLLAAAAGGRTRWSRAILSNGFSLNMINRRRRRRRRHKKVTREIRLKKKMMPLPLLPSLIQRKTQVLGELVPGCRKLSFSRLIEEATDYIAALEMQVQAMSTIAGVLNGGGDGASLPTDSEMTRIL